MRHVMNVSVADLELTETEIAFLQPKAKSIFDEFDKATGYTKQPKTRESFSSFLARDEVKRVHKGDISTVIGLKVVHAVALADQDDLVSKVKKVETVLDKETGLGIQHSSYGGINIGNPSGSTNLLVGSASLGNYCKTIGFKPARVEFSSGDSPRMFCRNIELIELTMSLEQYCMFIRGNKGIHTPCGLSRSLYWADDAPALVPVIENKRNLKREVDQIIQPVSVKLQALVQMIKAGASKKAEYADLVDGASEAYSYFQAVAEDISKLVKSAAMKEGEVAQRQFQADMADRLGQLKLSSSLNTMLRGLSHDTGEKDVSGE